MADVAAGEHPNEGAWIFVSHSHRDLNEVRRVRDALEAKGHQPLLFFLKCLGDGGEVDDLIRREIGARQFFLLCDSPNAKVSRWVQQEVRLIKDLPDKVRVNVALDSDWQTQLEAIDELSRRATVFLSYSRRSKESLRIVPLLASELRARDYRVLLEFDTLEPGCGWADQIRTGIDEAIEKGFVLVLLSPEALAAESVVTEAGYALERYIESGRPGIVPIIVSQPEQTLALLESSSPLQQVARMHCLDFTEGALAENIATLIRTLASHH
jgi:hypothetical protein